MKIITIILFAILCSTANAESYLKSESKYTAEVVDVCWGSADVAKKMQRNRQERGMKLHDAQAEIDKVLSRNNPSQKEIAALSGLAITVFNMPFYRDKDWVSAIVRDECLIANGWHDGQRPSMESLAIRDELSKGYPQ